VTGPRFQVRRSTYRGVAGWSLTGDGGRCSIFFEHECAARRTAAKKRKDPNYMTTLADWESVGVSGGDNGGVPVRSAFEHG
jgi:hypothetical protein